MKRIIFIDFETTGLDTNFDRLVEYACVETIDGNLTGRMIHSYIKPRRRISFEAYKIHGITNEFLENKPYFEEKVIEFLSFLQNSIVIAHNANFEVEILSNELDKINYCFDYYLKNIVIFDSLNLIRYVYKKKKNTLVYLTKLFKLNFKKKFLHSAITDSYALSLILIKSGLIKKFLEDYYEYNKYQ